VGDGAVAVLALEILGDGREDSAREAFRVIDVRKEGEERRGEGCAVAEARGGDDEVGEGVVRGGGHGWGIPSSLQNSEGQKMK